MHLCAVYFLLIVGILLQTTLRLTNICLWYIYCMHYKFDFPPAVYLRKCIILLCWSVCIGWAFLYIALKGWIPWRKNRGNCTHHNLQLWMTPKLNWYPWSLSKKGCADKLMECHPGCEPTAVTLPKIYVDHRSYGHCQLTEVLHY